MSTITYDQLSDGFKHMFPGGRFDSWQNLGDNKILFVGLKKDSQADKMDLTVDFSNYIDSLKGKNS